MEVIHARLSSSPSKACSGRRVGRGSICDHEGHQQRIPPNKDFEFFDGGGDPITALLLMPDDKSPFAALHLDTNIDYR
jgi:hypothetical protein